MSGRYIFDLEREAFAARLREAVDELARGALPSIGSEVTDRLYTHLLHLARWKELTSLVGPGAESELIERHYAESVAGVLSACGSPSCAVDLGSGAGFPGLVLAAIFPRCQVHLFEPRQRKAAFLRQAALRMGLAQVTVHELRVEDLGPATPAGARKVTSSRGAASHPRAQSVDCVTLRALRLTRPMLRSLRPFLRPEVRIVRWGSPDTLDPGLPLIELTTPSEPHSVGLPPRRRTTLYRLAETS